MAEERMRAWASGLFEGEGCISIYTKKTGSLRSQPKASLSMTDRTVVEQFATVIEFGNISSSQLRSGKTQYRWQTASWESVERLFSIIGPWLHERRTSRFREVLAQKPTRLLKPGECYASRTHCRHGHQLSAENTHLCNGRRRCRICLRRNAAQWRATNRRKPCIQTLSPTL